MQLKLTADPVVCNGICPQRLGHPPVRIRLPDWAHKAKLMHESPYLLVIHADAHMQESHMDAADPFVISAEFISFLDQQKALIITGILFNSFLSVS